MIVKERTESSPHWIKRLRKLNGITQKEISKITGVPVRLIRAYEIDASKAENQTIINIRRGLRIY